jgi:hypothetical protein
MEEYNYYKDQLERIRIEEKTRLRIKFFGEYPLSETHHLEINDISVDIFINFLQELKIKL